MIDEARARVFRAYYIETLAAAIAKDPESFVLPKTGDLLSWATSTVDKMIPALAEGHANFGSAAQAAARKVKCKTTQKAIKAYLTGAPEKEWTR